MCGRVDYKLALKDQRVIDAHEFSRQNFSDKQKNKITG